MASKDNSKYGGLALKNRSEWVKWWKWDCIDKFWNELELNYLYNYDDIFLGGKKYGAIFDLLKLI